MKDVSSIVLIAELITIYTGAHMFLLHKHIKTQHPAILKITTMWGLDTMAE